MVQAVLTLVVKVWLFGMSRLRHSVVSCPVCEGYLAKHLQEFHRIYSLDAVGDKDELIRF